MKFKSITMILTILLFIMGMAEFIMIFMKLQLPTAMVTISTILLFSVCMSEFIKTRKPRKLLYPLIIIYYLVVMPIIGSFINNRVLNIGFVVLSFVITGIFIYSDLMITNKEKELPH